MKDEDKEYYQCCLVCNSTSDLLMFAHRKINNGPICGWIFACSNHVNTVKNAIIDFVATE